MNATEEIQTPARAGGGAGCVTKSVIVLRGQEGSYFSIIVGMLYGGERETSMTTAYNGAE